MNEAVCRQRARALLQQLRITQLPVDVEGVAQACGLVVEYVARGKGFNGRLLRKRMVIEVEQSIHPHRQRFTISHEIGHYVLGHSSVFCASDDRSTSDPRRINEYEANVFASELLMPDAWVREHWQRLRDIQAMAEAFHVSTEAMFRRLDAAGLLGLERPL